MIILRCDVCAIDCKNYRNWISHLFTDGHQEKKDNVDKWQDALNERSFIVTGFSQPSAPEPSQDMLQEFNKLAWHFSEETIISDFYFDAVNFSYCIIQLDEKEGVNHLLSLNQKFRHHQLKLRRKTEISAIEWLAFTFEFDSKIQAVFTQHVELCKTLNTFKCLDLQFEKLFRRHTMSPEHFRRIDELVTYLYDQLKTKYPHCRVQPFGRNFIGLGGADEQLKVHIEFHGQLFQTAEDENMNDNAKDIEYLYTSGYFQNSRFIRTPILLNIDPQNPNIKFIYSGRDGVSLDCMLQSGNFCLLIHRDRLIQFLNFSDLRVVRLVAFVFYVLRLSLCDEVIQDPSYEYSILFLVFFFLTRKKILPSVKKLMELRHRALYINNVNYGFSEHMNKILVNTVKKPPFEADAVTGMPTARCILTLTQEFFEMLKNADFQTTVVCTLVSEFIDKKSCKESFVLRQHGFSGEEVTRTMPFNTDQPMCIQDPFDLSFNISHNITQPIVHRLQLLSDKISKRISEVVQNTDSPQLTDAFIPLDELKQYIISSVRTPENRIQQKPSGESAKDAQPQPNQLLLKISKKFRKRFATGLPELSQSDLDRIIQMQWYLFTKDFDLVWSKCYGFKIKYICDNSQTVVPIKIEPHSSEPLPKKRRRVSYNETVNSDCNSKITKELEFISRRPIWLRRKELFREMKKKKGKDLPLNFLASEEQLTKFVLKTIQTKNIKRTKFVCNIEINAENHKCETSAIITITSKVVNGACENSDDVSAAPILQELKRLFSRYITFKAKEFLKDKNNSVA